VHGVLFGTLAALLVLALRGGHRWTPWRAAIGAALLATIYGATDEIHQMWNPERMPDVLDALANAVGATLAGALTLAVPCRNRTDST